jgi:hypothetical protein
MKLPRALEAPLSQTSMVVAFKESTSETWQRTNTISTRHGTWHMLSLFLEQSCYIINLNVFITHVIYYSMKLWLFIIILCSWHVLYTAFWTRFMEYEITFFLTITSIINKIQ